MRNQTWSQTGELVKDEEIYLDGQTYVVKNNLTGGVRPATAEEITSYKLAERARLNWKQEWAAANTTIAKLRVLARFLDLEE